MVIKHNNMNNAKYIYIRYYKYIIILPIPGIIINQQLWQLRTIVTFSIVNNN